MYCCASTHSAFCGVGAPCKQTKPLQTDSVCWRPVPAEWHATPVWKLNGALFHWLMETSLFCLFYSTKSTSSWVMCRLTDCILEHLYTQIQIEQQKGVKYKEMSWGEGAVPSMVPHFVFLPSSLLPLTWYSWSLPTTANGIISCSQFQQGSTDNGVTNCSRFSTTTITRATSRAVCLQWSPHPDLLVDHSVLRILVKFFLRVHINPVGSQLFPDLLKACSNIQRNKFWEDRIFGPFNCRSNKAGVLYEVSRDIKQIHLKLHSVLIKRVLQLICLLIDSKSLGLD